MASPLQQAQPTESDNDRRSFVSKTPKGSVMTALTSALGMLPLAIASGAGNEILQPLAIVVLGGLFTSTALTLLVIPAIYAKFGKYLMPKQTPSEQALTSAVNPELQPW